LTTEIIPREKCRVCKIYLQKNCLNDICLKCSELKTKTNKFKYVSWRNVEGNPDVKFPDY
jgi:hypothetical protein